MVAQLFYLFVYISEALIAYMYFSDNYENKYKTTFSLMVSCGLYVF